MFFRVNQNECTQIKLFDIFLLLMPASVRAKEAMVFSV